MRASLILLLFNLLSVSANLLLRQNANSTCPGGVISCECSGAVGSLRWTIEIGGEEAPVRRILRYGDLDSPGPASIMSASIMSVLAEALLLSVNYESGSYPIYISVLNVTLSDQDVTVTCRELSGTSSTTILQITGIIWPILTRVSACISSG